MIPTFTIEVRTPAGWKVAPAVAHKPDLTEHEAHMLAAELYGPEYWAHFMGGEEKVRVAKVVAAA